MRLSVPLLYALLVSTALGQPVPLLDPERGPAIDNQSGIGRRHGSPAQGQTKITVAPPNWSTWRGAYSGISVEIGNPPAKIMPGGNDYGVVSAITGAIEIPSSANANVINRVTPGLIITSGVLGVASSASRIAPAVGVYGGAHIGAPNGQAWGANFTSKNYDTSGAPPKHGYNGQVYGLEVDVNLVPPAAGWGGSNVDGIWITGEWSAKADGQMNAVHIGAQGQSGWKNAIKTEHGSAIEFAEIGKLVKIGASPSQIIHLISSDGKSDYHTLIQSEADGSLSVKPNYYGAPKSLMVSSADPNRYVRLHPIEGVSTPAVTTRSLLVDLDGKGAKPVYVGPANSCGAGHRCLMVPN